MEGPAVRGGSVGSDDAQPSGLDGDPPDLVVSTAVGTATITATAKEVSQAGTRLDVNPSLTIVSTSDTASDITMAMIAETSSGACLGSTGRAEALDSPGWGPVHEFRCPRLAMPADFRGLPHLPESFPWRIRCQIAAP